ncbi:helix-turn-helix domain-containing protein [Enterobacter ludwigii]|uniref:helix-turn-helix domain-containing protein n=1 Tax=Enterobacter ludwigii TaxID=299767 RepID=UPI002A80CD48|nr:helix-turn-helix domain-containing protein [Enterobacter ludwigii]
MRKTREVIATPEASRNLKAAWDAKKKELKLTQELAAELLGFESQGTVSQYLNGKIPVNTDAALKFAALLKVKPEDIREDLKDLMNYVRSSDTYDETFSDKGWRLINGEQAELLNLFEILPTSEKTKLLEQLRGLNKLYEEAFENMLALKKRNL